MAKAKSNKKMVTLGMELPECPVCLENMSAPIFQCMSGHSICNNCNKVLCPPICPICREAMTQIRNWQLEDIISKASVACPNKAAGCNYITTVKTLERHLQECIFRDMKCPLGTVFGKCFWTGKVHNILDHVKERHPENCLLDADTEIDIQNISISIDDRHLYIVPQNKFLFIITFKIDTSQDLAFWAVQLIGNKVIARQHIYEIIITSKSDTKRKVTYSDHCYTDAYDIDKLFMSANCAVMPLKMLTHFIQNETLTFSCNVTRNQINKRETVPNSEEHTSDNQETGLKPTSAGPHPKGAGPKPRGPGGNNARFKSPGPHFHKGSKKQNNQ